MDKNARPPPKDFEALALLIYERLESISVGFHAELSRTRSEPPSSMIFWSGFGQGIGFFSPLLCRGNRAGFQAEAVVPCFQNMATMVKRSSKASVVLASPKTVAHSLKLRLVVMMTLVRS